jgi:hypothetical protein
MTEVFQIPAAPARALLLLAAIGALLLGLLLVFGYFALSSRFTRYEISSSGLSVRGTMYGRAIPWSGLVPADARVVSLSQSPELQPTMRTNGLGLPGYLAGWFRLRKAGKGLVFLTDRTRVVMVPTRLGYTLLLSAKEPERFVEALRRHAP